MLGLPPRTSKGGSPSRIVQKLQQPDRYWLRFYRAVLERLRLRQRISKIFLFCFKPVFTSLRTWDPCYLVLLVDIDVALQHLRKVKITALFDRAKDKS